MPVDTGTRLGAYAIVSPLGAGGMGKVCRATDTRLGRDIALKLLLRLSRPISSGSRASSARRSCWLRSITPASPTSYGFESAALEGGNTVHFIAMELVEGEDLARRLERGRIRVGEALEIAGQIADALEEAHGTGIVHRDLKPGNIKLAPDGKVKILDFGLAKAWSGDGTGTSPSAELSGVQ